MGILKKHIKKEIRWEKGDLILYNPREMQEVEINKIIKEQSEIDGDKNEVVAEYDIKLIKYFIRELTSIGSEIDEYSDEELSSMLDNGDNDLNSMLFEINMIVTELTEEMVNAMLTQVKLMNSMMKISEMKKSTKETKEKMNKVLKKQGLNITVDELNEIKDDPDKIQELIKKSNKNKSKKSKK